jgi:hypothetical protein
MPSVPRRTRYQALRNAGTVEFDGDIVLDAEKVDNIATCAVLPAEFLAQDLPTLKALPQGRLCRRRIVSQFSTATLQGQDVDQRGIPFNHSPEAVSKRYTVSDLPGRADFLRYRYNFRSARPPLLKGGAIELMDITSRSRTPSSSCTGNFAPGRVIARSGTHSNCFLLAWRG